MNKVIWTAILIAGACVLDEYLNHGYYTDTALTILRQMRHAIGL